MKPLRIAVPIFPGVDLIDVAAPVDILSRIPQFWTERTLVLDVVAASTTPITSGQNIPIVPTATFADYEKDPASVLLVPGAYETSGATTDDTYMAFIKGQAATAEYVTSVCTGALILGTAGLLDGHRATTHWAGITRLTQMSKQIQVVNGFPRWVHCCNRITGGGVSSSLDTAVYLVSVLTDEQTAKCAQLIVQYNPHPPYTTGDPSVADADTYLRVAY